MGSKDVGRSRSNCGNNNGGGEMRCAIKNFFGAAFLLGRIIAD